MQHPLFVFGKWFQIYFIENEGMAFGMKISEAPVGKIILTLFRLAAVCFGFWWIKKLVNRGYSKGLLICASLILAGAAGNLIDSMFYGMIFTDSDYSIARLVPFGKGYGAFLHGRVVDMFYFPVIDTILPSWIPFFGGKHFTFFDPIFNLADASISIGVITLLLFQKRLMKKNYVETTSENSVATTES